MSIQTTGQLTKKGVYTAVLGGQTDQVFTPPLLTGAAGLSDFRNSPIPSIHNIFACGQPAGIAFAREKLKNSGFYKFLTTSIVSFVLCIWD
jgi:hypothetical protein